MKVSKKWVFTKYDRDGDDQDEGQMVNDGCGVKFRNDHRSLAKWEAHEKNHLT